ncbi:MAG: transcriptional regulator [Leifsonia sp.]|nr:transcriptional regulator [Leifsonia sp.]
MTSTSPVRNPDVRSPEVMTRRAWWLVGLNLLVPGSAQVLAGSRRLGRFALGATFVGWVLVVAVLVLALVQRGWLLAFLTQPIVLAVGVSTLIFYALLWVVVTLDTLRLVRIVRVAPSARAPVALLAVAGLVVATGSASYGAASGVSALGVLSTVFGGGTMIAEPIDGRYNILLLGGDAGADRLGLRPDSISVVSIEAATGRSVIFGVPRNLEDVPFPADSPLADVFPDGYSCGSECLISYLYTYGEEHADLYPEAEESGSSPGIEAMRDAVSGVLGLELQYYVLVDMAAFENLIDALGGIDIDVQERLPIEGGLNEDGSLFGVEGWIEVGLQHMDGYTALWYARSRHSTDDYDRMQRQREVQAAVLEQIEPANVLLRFNELAAAGAALVTTDIPGTMLAHFAELALDAREFDLVTYDFVPPEVETWQPDFDAIRAVVDELTTAVTPSPTPVP